MSFSLAQKLMIVIKNDLPMNPETSIKNIFKPIQGRCVWFIVIYNLTIKNCYKNLEASS